MEREEIEHENITLEDLGEEVEFEVVPDDNATDFGFRISDFGLFRIPQSAFRNRKHQFIALPVMLKCMRLKLMLKEETLCFWIFLHTSVQNVEKK